MNEQTSATLPPEKDVESAPDKDVESAPDKGSSGTFTVPSYELPVSSFLCEETRQAIADAKEDGAELEQLWAHLFSSGDNADAEAMPAIRQQQAQLFYTSTLYKKLTDRYAVNVVPKTIGGVYTEVFTPQAGCADKNHARVLINFHGGSFISGSRTASHQESIPIAAVGEIKVVSVDYRMSPEHRFPAASNDALAVYRELLKEYQPGNIGIYGCSSGAMLSAQLIARLLQESLPLPGAIAMSCWSAHDIGGDSNHVVTAQAGMPPFEVSDMAYFERADKCDPLVIPGASPAVLAQFPPALCLTATRDFLMSTVLQTHTALVSLGVESELHVWDGLEHAFLLNPDFPESRQAYALMTNFFDRHSTPAEA